MPRPIPLGDLHTFVLALYSANQQSKHTIGKLRQMFNELRGTLGEDATTEELTTGAMVQWKALYAPGRGLHTVAGHLSNLRTICAIAVEEGWLDRPPTWRRLWPKLPRVELDDGEYWSLIEIAALLGYLRARVAHFADWKSRRLLAAVGVALYAGLRRDELLFLRLVDVDLEAGFIRVADHDDREGLKTGERMVPIAPELAAILADWLPHAGPVFAFPGVKRKSAWHGGKVGYRPSDELRDASQGPKIPPGTWQWARRTWATHAELVWLFSDPAIERMLGHSPRVSKRWYRRSDLDNLRAIGRRITYQG